MSNEQVSTVALYAGLFVLVNTAYLLFERDVLRQVVTDVLRDRAKRMAKRRSIGTLLVLPAHRRCRYGYFWLVSALSASP